MKEGSGDIYEFGRFSVDPAERLLFDGQATIPLAPKAFDTLLLLIENGGHVLSKEEIMESVWADSFVEENNLAQNISILRKALGEGVEGAKFIETVSKRGYRFIAPVSRLVPAEEDSLTVERTVARITIEETIDLEDDRNLPALGGGRRFRVFRRFRYRRRRSRRGMFKTAM